jgi:hypothetical protein
MEGVINNYLAFTIYVATLLKGSNEDSLLLKDFVMSQNLDPNGGL